jgi:hypothetical protein
MESRHSTPIEGAPRALSFAVAPGVVLELDKADSGGLVIAVLPEFGAEVRPLGAIVSLPCVYGDMGSEMVWIG